MFTKLLLLTFSTCLLFACDGSLKHAAISKNANVLILGDSLTYGTGADKGEDYPTLLANNTGWNVINAGVPGNTTADGLERLPEMIEAHDAGHQKIDFLIVELGGNDFLRQVPEAETVANLNVILDTVKAKKIPTALIAIPKFSPVGAAFGNLSDHPLYEKLSVASGVPLMKNVFSEVLGKNSLKSDPVHPNKEGYRIVEERLREELAALGFLSD